MYDVFFSTRLVKRFLLLLPVMWLLSACYPYQAYLYIVPDPKDMHRFKHEEVKHASECFEFKKRPTNQSLYVLNWTPDDPLCRAPLDAFLIKQKANHCLVIKNDTIVFEYHDKNITKYEPAPAFSMAKTLVSATFGVALKEGYIKSVDELAKHYLPELNYHPYFETLTINHLLNQTSGIIFEVDNISDAYYGKLEKVLTGIHFKAKPGTHLEYVNINTILIGVIIERTTGRNLHEYFSEKIWTKIGTCDSTVWAYDYKTKHTRSFGGFGASPRDYAKFGRLYLQKGKWGNEQVIDSNWVITSTSPVNALGENSGYNNYWFIGEKEIGDFMSMGMYKQQIYVNPKENVVIVTLMKFNEKNQPLRWWQILRHLAEQAGDDEKDPNNHNLSNSAK